MYFLHNPNLDLNVFFFPPHLGIQKKTGSKAFFSIFLYRNFGNFFQKASKISWIYSTNLFIFQKVSKISWIYPRKNSFFQKILNLLLKKSDKNCWKKSLVGRVENLRVVSGYPTSHKES
jgi:hypothetical protein